MTAPTPSPMPSEERPVDVERLYAAILDELVVLWGEPSDAVSTQVRPLVARSIAERYAAALPPDTREEPVSEPVEHQHKNSTEQLACPECRRPVSEPVDGLRAEFEPETKAGQAMVAWWLAGRTHPPTANRKRELVEHITAVELEASFRFAAAPAEERGGSGYSWDCPSCGERITTWTKPPDLAVHPKSGDPR